ncbi:MAG TPA: quinone-dependent dihydroorotate dehydrogenase [Methylomirabilota bacterium]|nr:quinone-dependent dihydroorotate dehydrogenase [Methylomirabilota bacterium]
MGLVYKSLLRPALFAQDSEAIHHRALRALHWASMVPVCRTIAGTLYSSPNLPVPLWDLDFPNPVGLAAGMDKQCEALPMWERLGFGFVEVGGITALEQPGNEKPRMFRAVAEEALVNRMGFNNPGCERAAQALSAWQAIRLWPKHPVGVNLGKSKVTPLEKAAEDYSRSVKALWPFVDFFVVNVSSPNTPNLRQLQDKGALDEILAATQEVNRAAAADFGRAAKPILVKVAPDLTFSALDDILSLMVSRSIAGLVATNTTIARPETFDPVAQKVFGETGGLSGKPLRSRSLEVVRHLYRQTGGKLPLIGVGGIFNGEDAWNMLAAGASLIQVYTGFVYEGPGLARSINKRLLGKMEERGFTSVQEVVGLDHRK